MRYIHVSLALFCFGSISLCAVDTHVYKQEFQTFKSLPQFQRAFNENANYAMGTLCADIETRKQLSFMYRALFYPILSDCILISRETMPALYGYVESVCAQHSIKIPYIFISRDVSSKKGLFNAFVSKLLLSAGCVVIGQRLLLDASDAALEAVIAHELGHVKYNHVNKIIALRLAVLAFLHYMDPCNSQDVLKATAKAYQAIVLADILIGKRFEKQADCFSYKTVGKAEGCKAFFNDLINREKVYNDDFKKTYALLQQAKPELTLTDSALLTTRYYCNSFFNVLRRASLWLAYHTPLDPHPSPEARLKTVESYMASEQQA